MAENPNPQDLNRLVALFSEARYAEAEVFALAMTRHFPRDPFGWKALGAILMQSGRSADALAPMQKAAELSPRDAETHKNLGALHRTLGQYAEAIASCRRALEIAPDLAEAHNNLGNAQLALGQIPEAAASYRRATELKPDFTPAHHNLAGAQNTLGQFVEAAASYRRALELKPDFVEAHVGLGHAQDSLRQFVEAAASYRRALTLKPDHAEAHISLGNALSNLGHLAEAVASYRQAMEHRRDFAEAHNNLGTVQKALGQLPEAVASYRRAVELKPDYFEAHSNLGDALKDLGQPTEAIASCRRALALNPDYATAHNNLGNVLSELGQFPEAIASYRRALELQPDDAYAHNNLSNALKTLGQFAEAAASCRRALALDPNFADAHNNLGSIFDKCGHFDAAVASYRRALELKPNLAEVHNNLGTALQGVGHVDEVVASYRRALALKPDLTLAHSNLIFVRSYQPGYPQGTLLADSRSFGDMAARKARPFTAWANVRQPDRCLRVGLVSGDLYQHPVGYFLENVLAALAAQAAGRLEFFAYSHQANGDEVTERIKSSCRGWHSTIGLSDEMLARRIHDDRIDILIDLAGHTARNRLPMFAWKPAPVQVSWLGYLATTGVTAIDYLIADAWTLPESEASSFTEKIWRLPESYLCFQPDIDLPVGATPAIAKGYITFGSFNNLTKMNDAVVTLWARILHAVPGSRLFLKTKQLGQDAVREAVTARFASHGIEAGRLMLEGHAPRVEHFAAYGQVDIALDPFPYPGITTTIEALWMGVPVLTLAGERFLSRQGVGIMMNARLPEWIATDADDYVTRAATHAGDLPKLARLRRGLRQQLRASPLLDAPRFAAHFEAALRGMWTRWCEGAGAVPVS